MRSIYDACYARLRPATHAVRERALAVLTEWQSVSRAVRSDHRPLTEDECRRLAQGDFVDVQSHTVNHLWLAAQPAEVQAAELGESRSRLEHVTGRPITALAYPYGFRDAVAPATLTLAREAGYAAACATVRGQVGRTTDPLWLPRHVPGDVDGDELAQRLEGFFDDFAMPHPPRGGAAQRAAQAAPKESL
jgi:peptidoglycan/xylan/chitin deacetylase (PgdA/CDA1 family)